LFENDPSKKRDYVFNKLYPQISQIHADFFSLSAKIREICGEYPVRFVKCIIPKKRDYDLKPAIQGGLLRRAQRKEQNQSIMKKNISTLLAIVSLMVAIPSATVADQAESGVGKDLLPIISQIQEKVKADKTSEADLAENFKAIDAVLFRHRADENKEELASGHLLKAQIYLQVQQDETKATAVINQVKRNFPGTAAANSADKMLAGIKAQAAGLAISRTLTPGAQFPDFAEKDLAGKPLSVAALKGKVVLIDFWATWCGPCREELPNVIEIYKKNHAHGFEVIGVSLDSDRERLEQFISAQGMAWAQYFDGEGWDNKLAKKYGVHSIPMTYLLGRDGKIIGRGLRGEELADAVTKALAGR
jgi:thiol-disulfide isomerase/thioredoxin